MTTLNILKDTALSATFKVKAPNCRRKLFEEAKPLRSQALFESMSSDVTAPTIL